MRETDDGRKSPVKITGDYDGSTRRAVLGGITAAFDLEYYEGLGQTLPRRHRGLGRLFGPLISPLFERRCVAPSQIVLESLVILLLLSGTASAQTLPWSGEKQKPAEAAAILANGEHWANISPAVAPLPEGVIGTPLKGSVYLYWYQGGSYATYGHYQRWSNGRGSGRTRRR